MKSVKTLNYIAILFEILLLVGFWIYLGRSNPDGLIIHKTCTTPDSFLSVNNLFFKGIECFLAYIICACILIPFRQVKNFLKIFPILVIFGLYVFNTLIIGILSLNVENIFIEIITAILLFFIPIIAIYFILCIIMLLSRESKK